MASRTRPVATCSTCGRFQRYKKITRRISGVEQECDSGAGGGDHPTTKSRADGARDIEPRIQATAGLIFQAAI
jgi:hypothetical protein